MTATRMSHADRLARRRAIAEAYLDPKQETLTSIAERFGVGMSTVNLSIAEYVPREQWRGQGGRPDASLSERNAAMVEEFLSGRTLQSIGDEYGMTRERVRQIVKHVVDDETKRKRHDERYPITALVRSLTGTPRQAELEAEYASIPEIAEAIGQGVYPEILTKAGWKARKRPSFGIPGQDYHAKQLGNNGCGPASIPMMGEWYRQYLATNPEARTIEAFAVWLNETGLDRASGQGVRRRLDSAGIKVDDFIRLNGGHENLPEGTRRPSIDKVRSDRVPDHVVLGYFDMFVMNCRIRDVRPTIAEYTRWRDRMLPTPPSPATVRKRLKSNWADGIAASLTRINNNNNNEGEQ